jgi:thiamine-phosphate pyrophosphorylase
MSGNEWEIVSLQHPDIPEVRQGASIANSVNGELPEASPNLRSTARSSQIRSALRLYLVMGSPNCVGTDPAALLEQALHGGITMFQFREKGPGALQGQAKLELGLRLRRLCERHAIHFIVNDEVELALALGADGIHIGQEDEPLSQVRERLKDKIMGVSAHNLGEAEAALRQGADYLGVGPLYPTRTKLDARAAQGPAILSRMRAGGIGLPLVGIGGIDAENAREVIRAGADGIAVVSSISQVASPRDAAMDLRQIVEENMSRKGSKL